MPSALRTLATAVLLSVAPAAAGSAAGFDRDEALRLSQAAVGRPLGDHPLTDVEGRPRRLAELRGKPLLVSMVFTACDHSCPVTTRRLAQAVAEARAALGAESFEVATIGFDTAHDTPERMRVFGRQQGIGPPGWTLFSAAPEAIGPLMSALGFVAWTTPRGFDHLTQVTVVDREGVVYAQVYGEAFELPQLVEPLKELVFNQPRRANGAPVTASLADRVRLFCTVYDPASGRYRFDYSLFVEVFVGLLVVLAVAAYLFAEWRRGRA